MKYIFGLAIWRKKISQIKGYVWPDWFCIRVVPLDMPWKEHQPLYVFFIFYFPFEYLKRLQSSEPLHTKLNPTSSLLGWRLDRILSSYWLGHVYLMKKSAKVLYYSGLDCGMLEFCTHIRNPKTNCCFSRISGYLFGG